MCCVKLRLTTLLVIQVVSVGGGGDSYGTLYSLFTKSKSFYKSKKNLSSLYKLGRHFSENQYFNYIKLISDIVFGIIVS